MSRAYRTALSRLAALRERLDLPNLSPDQRTALLAEFDDILQTLAGSEHKTQTKTLARRVAKLDADLADRSPAERNRAIIERLGISRSRLYELRAVHKQPDGTAI